MEFASCGFDIYTPEVDDYGFDLFAKTSSGKYIELQAKAIRQINYVFVKKSKWNIEDENIFFFTSFRRQPYARCLYDSSYSMEGT